jgi:hypothetical protein
MSNFTGCIGCGNNSTKRKASFAICLEMRGGVREQHQEWARDMTWDKGHGGMEHSSFVISEKRQQRGPHATKISGRIEERKGFWDGTGLGGTVSHFVFAY